MLYQTMCQKIAFFLVAALWVLHAQAAPTASAKKGESVKVFLEQFKVSTASDGKEVLTAATVAKPGDIIEYRASYKNVSAKPVTDLVATLPVPKNTEYQANSAMPSAGAEASIDNLTFAAVPLMSADKKMIATKSYKALRWKVTSLKANDAVVVAIRVKVSQE